MQLQSALGVVGLLAIAWLVSERRGAVAWKQVGLALALTIVVAVAAAEDPADRRRLRLCEPGGRRDCRRHPRRHHVRVRLSRRRPPALRSEDARRRIRARAAGAAGAAGHERAHDGAVLLARPAAVGARLLLGAGADHRRRRRGRAGDRHQHLRRPCRGAAVHPALSGAAHAQRAVHRDDRRHGRHRRHRAGALCHHARPGDPGRGGASRDRLGARRAGGDPRSA